MATPKSVFPTLRPNHVLTTLPDACVRTVPLRNLPLSADEKRRRGPAGNRKEYEMRLSADGVGHEEDGTGVRSLDHIRLGTLARLCSVSQTFGYAGREDVSKIIHGSHGKLLKREVSQVEYGSNEQLMRARGYASKLFQIVEDVVSADSACKEAGLPNKKTLVICHRYAGYKLLLRMLAKRLPFGAVRGFPPARTAAEKKDTAIVSLLGEDALSSFNRGDGHARVMVADAKECGEGVSFLGVRTVRRAASSHNPNALAHIQPNLPFSPHAAHPGGRALECRGSNAACRPCGPLHGPLDAA